MLRDGAEALRPGRLAVEGAAVGAATLALVGIHLQLWRARWPVPWAAEGDATFYLMVVRALGEGGGYLVNDQLGFPFGQRLHDLPQGADNANWLVLRVLAGLTGSPGAAVNLFYVGTFAAVAAVAYVALRLLGLRRATSAVGGVLYAVAPYHFARNEVHLLLSSYALVPVAVLLALALFDLDRRPGWREARTWWAVAGLVGLASTGAYYLAFALVVIAVAGATAAAARRRWLPLVVAAAMVAVAGAAFAVNVAPTLLEIARKGENTGVAVRTPGETELYGLRVSQLYSPRLDHRLGPLARLADDAVGNVLPSESGQPLGLVGAAGFTILLAVFALAVAGRRSDRRLERLALLTVACTLIATIGGFSYLLSAAGLRDIRSWNRMSILLAFCALAAALLCLERGCRWLARRRRWPAGRVLGVGLAVVAVVGWLDQTAPADVPPYAAAARRWDGDEAFFADVKARLGDGAAVLTVPHLPFPEMPSRGDLGPYDLAVGYVHEPSLRWTFGFMRGRHPEWPCALAAREPADQAARARALGLAGVVVDRRGDVVAGRAEAPWRTAVGAPVAESADGRYALFDLRGVPAPADADTLAADTLAADPGTKACYGT